MRTIAIINQKGGCGKTTTSINLAACLARLGQKTLLVDMDPQGHCAVGLAVPEEQIERTILDALIEERDGRVAGISQIVWQIATDFDLAPSNIRLATFEQMFAGRDGREDRLASALGTVCDHYNWCIIDCPPSVGLLTFNALRACDEVVVPVETGFFSLHGLTKMLETLEMLRDKCDQDVLVRVLPTLYDTRTKLAREVLSELRARFREYLMESTINFNTKLKEAASFGQPITEYDPGSRGYRDFVNLARELMGHRPVEVQEQPGEGLSRPAELVKRAKQLAQLTNFQFGRNAVPTAPATPAVPAAPATPAQQEEQFIGRLVAGPVNGNGNGKHTAGGRIAELLAEEPAESAEAPAPAVEAAPEAALPPRKTIEQKIEEFYGVKQVGAEVIFAAHFDSAERVVVAGDFNNWSQSGTPLQKKDKPGEWGAAMALSPGRYRYRFIVDGKWTTDPHNKYVEANQFGELDNVIEVE